MDPRAQARAEKAYRKAARPFYKKKRFIIPAVLVVLLIVIISSAGKPSGTPSSAPVAGATSSTACADSYPDKQDTDVCADGSGTVTLNDLAVTASQFTVGKGLTGKSLCTNVTIKNIGSESADYNVFDFKMQTPSGDVATTGTLGIDGTLNSGTLVAGGTKTGKVCSDNATEKGQYVFIYKPNAFIGDRGIWLFSI
jgi:Domain of unknown function (DUF4352)